MENVSRRVHSHRIEYKEVQCRVWYEDSMRCSYSIDDVELIGI